MKKFLKPSPRAVGTLSLYWMRASQAEMLNSCIIRKRVNKQVRWVRLFVKYKMKGETV